MELTHYFERMAPFDLIERIQHLPLSTFNVLDLGCGTYTSGVAEHMKKLPFKKLVSVDNYQPYLDTITAARQQFAATEHSIICHDIRTFPLYEAYNLVVMFDVLEHLEKNEGTVLLNKLENAIPNIGIFGPIEPKGFHRRNNELENPLQQHISYWYPDDFTARGYRVEVNEKTHTDFDETDGREEKFDTLWAFRFQ